MIRTFAIAALILASSAQAATITDVRVSGAGPVTFGQVFAVGDLKKSDVLVGAIGTTAVPLQVDVKATHADGSVRHAIISAQVPKAGTMQLNTGGVPALAGTVPTDLPAVVASATIGGIKYSASPSGAFKASWLQGPIVNEWQSAVPLTTAAGVAHPHLTARFAIRYFTASKKTRVDVAIENDWAYEPNPQNFTYDADISIGGKSVYSKAGLTHLIHARWRKVFWDGPIVQLNAKYLIASKAVPNYDQSFSMAEAPLAAIAATYTGARTEAMGVGMALPYMPTTGGRDDIGLLPMWSVAYLLSGDERARQATMGTGDLAGSWATHYRDRNTDRPISLLDYPAMTVGGKASDTLDPVTKKFDAFPACAGQVACETPYQVDTSHQASFAYLPYLVTGDYYYLEELQFWAMWNVFGDNPNYRQWAKGLVSPGQVRAQAWSLRTLGEAAYITPDSDALKPQFAAVLDSNLTWYNDTYVAGGANKLGIITNGYAYSYQNETAIAPWQDDHFTSAIGHVAELGFAKAASLLTWKAKFQIGRMLDPGFCWIDSAVYNMKLRDSANGPVYDTLAKVYQASVDPKLAALKCNSVEQLAYRNSIRGGDEPVPFVLNDMPGYAASVAGYPSNFQPALAMAVDSGYPGGAVAWTTFATRAVRPNYANGPQFAIVPRGPVAPPIIVPAPPKVAKVTTGSNTKLAKQTGLTVVFLDPVKLSLVKSFTGVTATSKGAFTVSDVLLQPGAQYLVAVISSAGKPLDAFLLTVPK